MQEVSLLMEVAGLKEKWVEVKRHAVKVLLSTGTTLDEAFSSKESQRLHVFRIYPSCFIFEAGCFPVVDESCSQTALRVLPLVWLLLC